ncbi:hypothetical protein GYMLUDRAFT_51909 [Collybiopsis luxurians FD-317 M1]|nr:hypothetical protein GYMLUDRAFT_51909 [Collybiopsis luxurians FD-317 M1]
MNYGTNRAYTNGYEGYDYQNGGFDYSNVYDESFEDGTLQHRYEADPYTDDYSTNSGDYPEDKDVLYDGRFRSRSHHDLFAENGDGSPERRRPYYAKSYSKNGQRPTQQPDKIPVPSSSYLKLVNQPSVRLTDPTQSRKLLVLDLNGTLLYREPRTRDGRDPYATDEPRPLRATHTRPYIPSFKAFLFHPETRKWLDTMVWSSAQFPNVKDMVGRCFGQDQVAEYMDQVDDQQAAAEGKEIKDQMKGLVAIWDRKFLGLSQVQYRNKFQTTKNLAKPWDLLPLSSFSGPVKALSDAWDRVATDEAEAVPPSDPGASTTRNESRLNHISFLERLMEDCRPSRNELLSHSALSTILLDDSPLKARMQPYNHVCVPEYQEQLYIRDVRIAESLPRESTDNLPVVAGRVPPTSVLPFNDEGLIGKRKRSSSSSAHIFPPSKKIREFDPEDWDILSKHHDHIILAVIGLLDALKYESSIPAWVKARGLFAAENFDLTSLGEDLEVKRIVENNDEELDRLYRESVPEGIEGTARSAKRKERHRKRRRGRDSALSSRSEQSDGSMAAADYSEHGNDIGVNADTDDDLWSSRAGSLEFLNSSQYSISTEPDSRPSTPDSRDFMNCSGTTTEPASPPSAGLRRELQRKAHLLPRPAHKNVPKVSSIAQLKKSRPPTPTFVDSLVLYGAAADSPQGSPGPKSSPDAKQHQLSGNAGSSLGEKDIFSNPRASPPGLTGRVHELDEDFAAEKPEVLTVAESNAESVQDSAGPESDHPLISLPSLWYQHPPARWNWVRRGVLALKELDLDVIPGVKIETD